MTAWQPMRWMTGGACTTLRFGPSVTTISWTCVIRKEPSRMAAANRSMMSCFLSRRKALRLSFFKSPSTSSKLALMLPCSMIASMRFPYRFIAFRSLWLVTFAYATSNMPQFFCFGLLVKEINFLHKGLPWLKPLALAGGDTSPWYRND